MADEIDIAQEREEELRAEALKKRKPVVRMPGGECLYCADKLPVTRRWCNSDCRDAWELEQRREFLAGDDDNDAG